jgi:hypothetical protein
VDPLGDPGADELNIESSREDCPLEVDGPCDEAPRPNGVEGVDGAAKRLLPPMRESITLGS